MRKEKKKPVRKVEIDFRFGYYYNMYHRRYGTKYTQKEVRKILGLFFKLVFREIIYNMYEFSMYGLITFFLIKQKQKLTYEKNGQIRVPKNLINWQETRKMGKPVYYDLSNTNGYYYKLFYSKSNFVNRRWYKFKLHRFRRAEITRAIEEYDGNLPAFDFFDSEDAYKIRQSIFKRTEKQKQWYQSAKLSLESGNIPS